MTSVLINAPVGYYICYKSGTGRTLAMSRSFATETWAQAYLERHGNVETMHVVRKEKENA